MVNAPYRVLYTGLRERSRNGIMEGFTVLRKVGQLSEGILLFQVRRPQFKDGCSELAIRDGPEELTLRAEEVEHLKSCINVDHIPEDRWGPTYADWHASGQVIYKGIYGSEWENCTIQFQEIRSNAARVKKPNESQKARALWRMNPERTGQCFGKK